MEPTLRKELDFKILFDTLADKSGVVKLDALSSCWPSNEAKPLSLPSDCLSVWSELVDGKGCLDWEAFSKGIRKALQRFLDDDGTSAPPPGNLRNPWEERRRNSVSASDIKNYLKSCGKDELVRALLDSRKELKSCQASLQVTSLARRDTSGNYERSELANIACSLLDLPAAKIAAEQEKKETLLSITTQQLYSSSRKQERPTSTFPKPPLETGGNLSQQDVSLSKKQSALHRTPNETESHLNHQHAVLSRSMMAMSRLPSPPTRSLTGGPLQSTSGSSLLQHHRRHERHSSVTVPKRTSGSESPPIVLTPADSIQLNHHQSTTSGVKMHKRSRSLASSYPLTSTKQDFPVLPTNQPHVNKVATTRTPATFVPPATNLDQGPISDL